MQAHLTDKGVDPMTIRRRPMLATGIALILGALALAAALDQGALWLLDSGADPRHVDWSLGSITTVLRHGLVPAGAVLATLALVLPLMVPEPASEAAPEPEPELRF